MSYTLTITLQGLILNTLDSQLKGKDNYFYVGGDIG